MEVLKVPQLYTTDILGEYRYKLRVELTKLFRRPEKYNAKATFDTYPFLASRYPDSLTIDGIETHWPGSQEWLPMCEELLNRLVYIEVSVLVRFSIEHVCFLSPDSIGKFIVAVYGHLLPISVVKYLALSIEGLYSSYAKGALQLVCLNGKKPQQVALGLYLCDSYCIEEPVSNLLRYLRDLTNRISEIKSIGEQNTKEHGGRLVVS